MKLFNSKPTNDKKNKPLNGVSNFKYAKIKIKKMYEKYPMLCKGLVTASVLGSMLFSGRLYCETLVNQRRLNDITIFTCLRYSFSNPIITIIFIVVCLMVSWYLINRFYHPADIDEERNLQISDTGSAGTDHPQTDEELKDNYKHYENFEDTLKDGNFIMGGHPRKPEVMLARNFPMLVGGNNNALYCGIPGSMKTRSVVIPMIIQAIRAGVSVIVADPKLEIYRITNRFARKHGVKTKCLNFKKETMPYSDSCNFMKNVGLNETNALSFSDTFIKCCMNLGEKEDFWMEGANNLLAACILYVNDDELNAGEYDKSLQGVFELLNKNKVEALTTKFSKGLQANRPCSAAWNIFDSAEGKSADQVKSSTRQTLLNKMRLMIDTVVGKIVSEDDIDMEEIGRTPCIYYLGFSDTDSAFENFSALYFNLQFQTLFAYADSFEGGKLPVRVIFLLDEIRSIGPIPEFQKKLSTCRGRNIDIVAIVQSLSMLQDMYGASWKQVFECFDIRVCLKAGSQETAKEFSDLTGTMTTLVKNVSYTQGQGDLSDNGNGIERITLSDKARPVYTPGEIIHMDPENMLVVIGQAQSTMMKKIDYEIFPHADELIDSPIEENYPLWARKLSQLERNACRITSGTYYEAIKAMKNPKNIKMLPEEAFQVSFMERKKINYSRLIDKFGLEKIDPRGYEKKNKNKNEDKLSLGKLLKKES